MARKRPDRRTVLIIGLGVVVAAVVVAFVVVFVTNRDGGPEPAATTTLPVPTPESEPIPRETTTPLLAALPDTVLGYAVSAQEAYPAFVDAGALEAWQLTYGSAEGDVVLRVGQWESAEEAADVAASLLTAATVVDEGVVEVAGEQVGTYRVVETPEGAGGAVWTNATAVFVAEGADADTLETFYRAYPL